ncbi:hypothetical protein C8A01DRAFT_21445 [Parachaetomium inaequale]|uniref:Uncharacterized protein n=1 Tax=Parachaetomium inaequale TaxID=2588326 RepID=A0AAN6SL50_9PEZI|nr:hypothetical protein C8A01DRAFT_21445 [Parachaetomium inaequale]
MTKGSRPSPTYRSHPVVTIRWETSDSYYKISLPFLDANDENGFEKLVNHYSEHFIESFSVDFHPYDYGVVDTVAQVLTQGDSRVKLHLTALDIYGPSYTGSFPDADGLCSDQEFASLVVCLPLEHDGGLLAVRRQEKEENFDWAAESTFYKIQWAAFLCGSEVIQSKITRGYYITLTYRLFRTTYGIGAIAGLLYILDEKSFTWYKMLRNAINTMDRKEEVLLGFICTSVYSHISIAACDNIYRILEGEDMAIYYILKRLATDIRVDMVLDDKPVKGEYRRGARTVIADSQEDESQLFDDGCKQPAV